MVNQMAYVNVAEWSPEHVAEWLRGLEYSLLPYVQFFLNNGIDGRHLLNLTANDLEDLHIFKIGHQQLILEAVELLRQLHYSLNSETLQSLAVKLSCRARSLHNDLKINGPRDHIENVRQERISTNVLLSVSEVLTSVKGLVSWLDRPPFQQDPVCIKLKKTVLRLSIELASTTQRDQFAERPHSLIKKNSAHLAELCDQFVQNSMDSLILQPAALDIATIRKKSDEELGIHIKSTYSGVHIIGGIKDQSPAKSCNKVERGDEIVQVNYQTVIGWQQKKLVTTMTENSVELQLTLKKRPRHVNLLGEVVILRPYRIPSKKTAKICYNWSEENQMSVIEINSESKENECERDDFQDDDSPFLPASSNKLLLSKELSLKCRLFEGNTVAAVQRRATVSCSSPTILHSPVSFEDLVNGMFSAKSSDYFGRSISHDFSCQRKNSEIANISSHKFEGGHDFSREVFDKNVSVDCKNRSISNNSAVSHFSSSNNACPNKAINTKEKDEASILGVLSVQHDNIALENKSSNRTNVPIPLQKKNSLCEKIDISSNFTDSQPTSGDSFGKSSSVLYNWEGAVTEFRGRRPSAHDISNEIAGSKETDINPVFLRKASKLETSPLNKEENSCNSPEDLNSYQVVIVAGVPQKSVPFTKDEKDKNKSFELLLNRHKIKEKLSGQYRSRRISCKDLGQGDCEGWLYKQKERKGFFPTIHQWAKRWIVLKDNFLYCYKDKNDTKAECLMSLPGSIVSPATECKTKKFAFKISQKQIHFYLATESQRDLTNWMNKMGLAAIAYDATEEFTTSGFLKPDVVLGITNNFYSETDDSGSESPTISRHKIHSHATETNVCSQGNLLSSQRRKELSNRFWNENVLPSAINSKISNMQYVNQELKTFEVLQRDASNIEKINSSVKSRAALKPTSSEPSVMPNYKYISENCRISCNVSLNCAESYTHCRDVRRNIGTLSNQNSCDSESIYENDYDDEIGNTLNFSDWNSLGEDFNVATSSLGRPQKPFVKEITPGLVARMAVSYTNLSKTNSSIAIKSNNKYNISKGIPPPGYVAKISDSFDHLALQNKSNVPNIEKSRLQEFSNTEREKYIQQSYKCVRSASESQVTSDSADNSQYTKPLSVGTSAVNSQLFSHHKNSSASESGKFISLLDKEYNKVFEGKKVSQHQLKSPASQSKCLSIIQKEKRLFPNNNHSEKFCSLNVNQSICRDDKTCGNLGALPKGNRNENVGKSFSLPFSGNMSNEICSPYTCSSQFSEKALSSCEGIKNIGFSYNDPVNFEDTDVSLLQSLKTTNPQLQFENSACSCEFGDLRRNSTSEKTASDTDSPKTTFKFFNSPKFMKKLTSPKLDKKNIFKSKKQSKENKKADQKEITLHQNEKKFFGSPILARTFFGSPKPEKKIVTVSSGVQTDFAPLTAANPGISEATRDQNSNQHNSDLELPQAVSSGAESCCGLTISQSSSNLTASTSNCCSPFTNSIYYVEAKIKPQITVSLPFVSDKTAEDKTSLSDLSRILLKPMMGVAMLNKKRLPSISGESSISVSSSKSSQDGSFKETTQALSEVSMEINGDEEVDHELKEVSEGNGSICSTVPNLEEMENSDASC